MKFFTPLLLLFSFTIDGGLLKAQAFMGFENLMTAQTCTTVSCQYVDPDSRFSAHDLRDNGGIPVSSPSLGAILGFSARFTPTRPNIAEFSDGQFFGYAGPNTVQDDLGQFPTPAGQAYMMEDTDGQIDLTFDLVDLTGVNNAMFSMNYILDGTFEVTDGVNDLLRIEIEVSDCASATNLVLLTANGNGSGGAANLNTLTDNVWLTATQDLSPFGGCKAQLKISVDCDATTEEFAFDNISFTGGVTLPVEFMSFTANQYKESVILDWSTATETDNRGFSVERSLDGTSFAPIGWVSGSGNAGAQVDYQFEDSEVTTGRDYYYRLRQEDFDGAFDYSSIVNVSLAGGSKNKVDGRIYPNPANNGLSNLELFPTSDGAWTVSVLDANGRLITESKHNLSTGYNLVPLDLSTQPVGTYLVRVAGQKETIYRKVIR